MTKLYYVETGAYDMLVADCDGTITYFIDNNRCHPLEDVRRDEYDCQIHGAEARVVCEKFLREADLDPSGWEIFDGTLSEILNGDGNIIHAEVEKKDIKEDI